MKVWVMVEADVEEGTSLKSVGDEVIDVLFEKTDMFDRVYEVEVLKGGSAESYRTNGIVGVSKS